MQLTKDQQTSIVLKFNETKNCEQVRTEFEQRFPDKKISIKKTIYQIVRKFIKHVTILNQNKGNSGKSSIQRTESTSEATSN